MTEPGTDKHCPKCGAVNLVAELPQRDYRCGDCGLELAHLDLLPNGAVRDVLGWVLDVDRLINERYRITALLGKGGFGVTYLVDDVRLHGKRRALKEVPALLFDEYETRLLGRLNHPAVPDITDRFTIGGMVYQVLEFGGDRTLRIEQERRGGRIPVFVLLPWVQQLCEALQYLHSQDPPVVHRDLKPDNVLIDEHGRIMLIDFGIAKEVTVDTMTRTIGRAVTQGFSPPEQVLGTGTDARSDVYALGAIMYYCLTGRMPPAAHERVTGQVVQPLYELLPSIPPLLEATVMQALELNINLRQQGIADLGIVFDLILSGSGSSRTVVAPSRAATAPTATAGVTLPSLQLPSRRTNPVTAVASIGISEPSSIAVDPPRRRTGLTAILAAIVFIAAGGGYWWYLAHPRAPTPNAAGAGGPAPSTTATPTVARKLDPASESQTTPTVAAGSVDLQPRDLAPSQPAPKKISVGASDQMGIVDSGSLAPPAEPNASPPASALTSSTAIDDTTVHPGTQDAPRAAGTEPNAPPTGTAATQLPDPVTPSASADPARPAAIGAATPASTSSDPVIDATIVEASATETAVTGATAAAVATTAAALATAPASTASTQPAAPPSAAPPRLTSIFSDEQPRPISGSAGTDRSGSIGSGTQGSGNLMDLFDGHRSSALSVPPTPAPAPVKPAPTATPKASATPTAKPKAAPKPSVVAKPKPRAPTQPSANSASDWGFQYKGARKTD